MPDARRQALRVEYGQHPSANHRQAHRQALSPKLFRSMEMLAMPSADLQGFLRGAVEDNVMLTLDSDAPADLSVLSLDEAVPTLGEEEPRTQADAELGDPMGSEGFVGRRGGTAAPHLAVYDDERLVASLSQGRLTLPQYLLCQCSPDDEALFLEVADYLDDRGYFQGDVEAIAFRTGCTVDAVDAELARIRSLEPRGVGAENVRECLLLQLDPGDDGYELMRDLVENRLEDIPTLRPGSIARAYNVTCKEGCRALSVLRSLDPCPGRPFARVYPPDYLTPDIVVSSDGRAFQASLCLSETAGLAIDKEYRALAASGSLDREARDYLADKERQACELLRDVAFRHKVITRLAAYILARQQRFFESRGALVEVLNVKDAAMELGVHPSTVSRALAGKTMRTPFGLYPLSVFFKTGVTAASEGSDDEESYGAIATLQVKSMIKRCIEGEDRLRPLSDSALCEELVAQGVRIERRTVAKYRESLDIPCSTQRRRLYARNG